MSPIRLIASDVDGCITPEQSVAWPLGPMAEFVTLCRSAGRGNGAPPAITLCTGRPQPYVEALMKLLDVRAPAICENGAVIYTLHDNRARYGPGVTREKIAALGEVRDFIEYNLLPQHPNCVLQFGKVAQVSVFSEKPKSLLPLVAPIEEFVRQQGKLTLDIKPSLYYLNISFSDVTKGRTLGELLKEMRCPRNEAAGIGDTDGDLSMREQVGYFASPANGTKAIRAVADYVSKEKELAGVMDILNQPALRV